MGSFCTSYQRQKRTNSVSNNPRTSSVKKPIRIFAKDIIVATHDFNDELKIGSGGFGEVYKAKLQPYGTVAVKRIKEGISKELLIENRFLMQYEHPNLVKLYESIQVKGHYCLIMQYVSNGNLKSKLKEKDYNLNFIIRLQVCLGVAKGIYFLHSAFNYSLIHRDIKSANILLDENYIPKICDFGLTTLLAKGSSKNGVTISEVNAGTRGYSPPEARVGIISRRYDVYSFGVVILEIISGLANSANNRKFRYLAEYFRYCYCYDKWQFRLDPVANWPRKTAWKLMALAKACLESSRYERPDMGSIVNYLTAINQQRQISRRNSSVQEGT